jgi:broad specificity phosphatase PhoE
MNIYLVRHGESASDVRQKYDGEYDDLLTDKGRKEAEEIAQKLKGKDIEVIFSSERLRARETAEIMRAILNCKVIVMEELNEQDIYGAYPELSVEQPEEEYRRLGELLADRNGSFPDVETYQQLKRRVAEGFSEIIRGSYHTVAIVTHGGPIRSIVRDILKEGELQDMTNGMIIELEATPSYIKIIRMNGVRLPREDAERAP